MTIKHHKIFGLDFTFVFRYRYEKGDENELLHKMTMWGDWRIGFFFKSSKVVGKRNFHKPKEWNNNLVKEYMIGVDLLIYKTWFTISKGVMKINIDEK